MNGLNIAISEIKRALINNKSSEVKEVYLRNAIRFIEEAQVSKLNENQQVVLEWLKVNNRETENPFETLNELREDVFYVFYSGYCRTSTQEIYWKLTKKEQFELLQAFAEWGLKSEGE